MEVIFLYCVGSSFFFWEEIALVPLVSQEVPFVILMGEHVLCEIRAFVILAYGSLNLCKIQKHYPFGGAGGGHKGNGYSTTAVPACGS